MSQPMHNRYTDFEELRPTGEASPFRTRGWTTAVRVPGVNASRRNSDMLPFCADGPAGGSASPVGRQSQTAQTEMPVLSHQLSQK